jgi:hypothetical protein
MTRCGYSGRYRWTASVWSDYAWALRAAGLGPMIITALDGAIAHLVITFE